MYPNRSTVTIILRETLDDRWGDWFDGLTLTSLPGGGTQMRGVIADQSGLHAHLERIRDLNLTLFSVCVEES